ncbi:hypothetical protein BGZ65_005252, partial [Modicella reniformis]
QRKIKMDSDEEIRRLDRNKKTLKPQGSETSLEDQDVEDDDIEMVLINKECKDNDEI